MAINNIVDQATLKMQVYKYLRDQIFTGELPIGQRLVITEIAENLNVSLTPVREAISQLTVEGYVTTLPRKGTFVKEFSSQEFLDAYEVLGVLDAYAAELAAARISDEALNEVEDLSRELYKDISIDHYVDLNWKIHGLIARESGNQSLLRITNRLRAEVIRNRYVSLAVDKRMDASRDEHHKIVESLKKHDSKLAADVMKEHRENTFKAMKEYIKSRESKNNQS